jgi:purine-nucleoside phosphorylase
VLIRDHLNLMGVHPLRGPNPPGYGPRFPDMSEAYSRQLRGIAQEAAGADLAEGVYAAFPGPSYETPAEVRLAELLGADLVGMSTVPEVIAARYLGMRVLGISCVTNMAAGILERPLEHAQVVETGRRAMPALTRLLQGVLERLGA